MTTDTGIPREVALELCGEIRAENKKKLFSIWGLQCFFCYKWAKGDVEKMCLSSEGGCNLVNRRFKLRWGDKSKEVTNEHQRKVYRVRKPVG